MRIEKQCDSFYGDVWVLVGETEIIGRYLSENEANRIMAIVSGSCSDIIENHVE